MTTTPKKQVLFEHELDKDPRIAGYVAGKNSTFLQKIEEAFPGTEIKRSKNSNTKVIISGNDNMTVSSVLKLMGEKANQQNSSLYLNDLNECIKTVKKQNQDGAPVQEKFASNNNDILLVTGNNGKKIFAKTPNQKKLYNATKQSDIVFAIGPAGTGKTYAAVAMAVKALQDKQVKKIILTRPAVEAGENLGFLPGDLKEKIDPYLRPLYDALDDMIAPDKLAYYMQNRIIEIAPLAYMRGRTLDDAYIILDEAQNTTDLQLKMFLTRIGPKAKAIVTGDMEQVDLPTKQRSGLATASKILEPIDGISVVRMTGEDNMRHELVKKITSAYSKFDENERLMEEQKKHVRKAVQTHDAKQQPG